MKRYTGQKALYEAISRSRVKARRGNILERLKPEAQVPPELIPPQEPVPTKAAEASEELPQSAVVQEPVRPLLEKLRQAVIAKENAKLGRSVVAANVAKSEERPAPLPVKPRPVEKPQQATPPGMRQTWWRLRPVQLNGGRIEISVPYHIGAVVGLLVLLVVLASFRVGQEYSRARGLAPMSIETPVRADGQNGKTQVAASGTSSSAATSAQTGGDHWIVLAQHKNREDLVPVVEYFAKYGIELSIYELGSLRQRFKETGLNPASLPRGDGYLLTTQNLYSNPNRRGTDGYEVVQKIVQLGKNYKAPPGRDTFAAKHFGDAYGMKITSLAQ